MNRSDLIARIAKRQPRLLVKDTALAVKVILEALSAALSNGGRVEIRGFGTFDLIYRPPRLGRNPRTGARVAIPGKYLPHFKPGRQLRKRVDK